MEIRATCRERDLEIILFRVVSGNHGIGRIIREIIHTVTGENCSTISAIVVNSITTMMVLLGVVVNVLIGVGILVFLFLGEIARSRHE